MTGRYTDMNAGDMLQALGDDAMKWADAFCEKFPDFDHEDAFGWFANAIENSWDTRCSRATHSDDGLLDHMSALIRNRDTWRELAALPPHDPAAATLSTEL